nr:hypothetical protein [Paenibacillus sp. MER TA 81-3]
MSRTTELEMITKRCVLTSVPNRWMLTRDYGECERLQSVRLV